MTCRPRAAFDGDTEMSEFNWRYDPAKVAVGDTIYMANGGGWGTPTVNKYTVQKVTPSGQVAIVSAAGHVERITPRGSIVGESTYGSRRIISEATAREYVERRKIEALWQEISKAADSLQQASRRDRHDIEALDAAIATITAARARLIVETD